MKSSYTQKNPEKNPVKFEKIRKTRKNSKNPKNPRIFLNSVHLIWEWTTPRNFYGRLVLIGIFFLFGRVPVGRWFTGRAGPGTRSRLAWYLPAERPVAWRGRSSSSNLHGAVMASQLSGCSGHVALFYTRQTFRNGLMLIVWALPTTRINIWLIRR